MILFNPPCPDASPVCYWGDALLPVVLAEKYLGLWFTADLSFTKQLGSSLSKGTALLNAVSPLLRDGRISARAKLDLIRTCCLYSHMRLRSGFPPRWPKRTLSAALTAFSHAL